MERSYKSRETDEIVKKYRKIKELQEEKQGLEIRGKDSRSINRELEKAKAEALKLRQEIEPIGKTGYIIRDKNLMEKKQRQLKLKEYQEDLKKVKREIDQGANTKELISLERILENKILEMKRGL